MKQESINTRRQGGSATRARAGAPPGAHGGRDLPRDRLRPRAEPRLPPGLLRGLPEGQVQAASLHGGAEEPRQTDAPQTAAILRNSRQEDGRRHTNYICNVHISDSVFHSQTKRTVERRILFRSGSDQQTSIEGARFCFLRSTGRNERNYPEPEAGGTEGRGTGGRGTEARGTEAPRHEARGHEAPQGGSQAEGSQAPGRGQPGDQGQQGRGQPRRRFLAVLRP